MSNITKLILRKSCALFQYYVNIATLLLPDIAIDWTLESLDNN